MAYNVRNLRPQSVFGGFGSFDDMTPNYGDSGGYDPNQEMMSAYNPPPPTDFGREVLDPTGQPLRQESPPAIEAPKVDPNSGMTLKDWFNAINEGYTPQTYARDRFNTAIDQFPERQAPSGAMRWAAGLQGISQVGRQGGNPAKTVDDILNIEGNRNIEDWKTRIDPYHKAATLEGTANTQERTLMGNAVTGYMNDQRVREQARKADMQNEASMVRARAYAAKNARMQIIKAGDRLIGIDENNQRHDIGPSGALSREEEINLLGEWGVKRAEAGAGAAIERQASNPAGQLIINGMPHRYDPKADEWVPVPIRGVNSGGAPSGGASGTPTIRRPGTETGDKPVSQLEKNRIEQKQMEDLWLGDPYARRFIAKQGNEYVRKPRPVPREETYWESWIPGDQSVPQSKADEYDAFWTKHDPNYKPPTPGTTPSGAAPAPPAGARPTPRVSGGGMFDQDAGSDTGDERGYAVGTERPGMIRMRAPDGSIRYVPGEKVAEAEKNGMRRLR